MAKATLGKPGQMIAWLSYLFLLYALLCAYISAGGDIVHHLLALINISTPNWLGAIIIVVILGAIVIRGIYSVDIVNRGLMSVKFVIFFVLIALIAPHVTITELLPGGSSIKIATIMVMITSFGYAIIMPSLRSYLNSDTKKLRQAILIGSLIPLFFYLAWIAVVQGVIAKTGSGGLLQISHSGHAVSGLTNALRIRLNNVWITDIARVFTSICALTSFMGVSLALTDFLADGLKLKKQGKSAMLIYTVTFLPPLAIVLFYPGIFITALGYAGIFCVILLMLLPAAMAWGGRYVTKIAGGYQVIGGKPLLIIEMIIACGLIVWAFTL